MHIYKWGILTYFCLMPNLSQAEMAPLLAAQDAFPLNIVSLQENQAQLTWTIPDHYYIYQHSIEVKQAQKNIPLDLPKAHELYDENYGNTQVFYHDVQLNIPTQANQNYQVVWQGCAKNRICYPPQSIHFETDQFGLVRQQSADLSAKLIDLNQPTQHQTFEPSIASSKNVQSAEKAEQVVLADDLKWSAQLGQHSFAYGLLLFLGLGILLAFTPCSLPMLPILTSSIVRDRKGLKAWTISLVFVLSLASVYAILGLVASTAGLGFQRWLQQPSTLIAFSILFVIFACNLFGWFELRLPQAVVNRLDRVQGSQRGGTLVGAAMMGMISALLVGPCMTAPLAGALLFISQTQNQWQGAILLFSLGLGMGLPLLIASVLGAKILPKAGIWMNQVRVLFAFIMLALALYFIRPLLPLMMFTLLSTLLALGAMLYAMVRITQFKYRFRWMYSAALLLSMCGVIYLQYQAYQDQQIQLANTQLQWHVVHDETSLKQALAQAPKDQAIVIDVYADWCIACQPIEHKILKTAAVQQALAPYFLIKLDLSQYDTSHQALLNQWEILGPPTYLFLTSNQHEVRALRLTGAFNVATLLAQLQALQQAEAKLSQ